MSKDLTKQLLEDFTVKVFEGKRTPEEMKIILESDLAILDLKLEETNPEAIQAYFNLIFKTYGVTEAAEQQIREDSETLLSILTKESIKKIYNECKRQFKAKI